ncbi:autotransporter-associated beta strand repeat-containing protein [Bordetella sp. LUAb4]|uniref:autotransporter-associated beta strand repeat-containing protein n=1 Tax=Bordetella sp. LUAb4 TaxID=2843195 RepID=UPI001E4426AB|nr:autotransporter-associated beta strand repeat-containing protein [Bordetella sp. LUAb4]
MRSFANSCIRRNTQRPSSARFPLKLLPSALYFALAGLAAPAAAADLNIGGPTDGVYASSITGPDGVIKEGAGKETLTGINTYSGATTINAGTLAAGAADSFSSASSFSLTTIGTALDISAGGDQTIGSLAGVAGSTVTLGGNMLTVGGNNGSTTFGGVISGSGSLTKTGSGTLTLNAVNTYSGGTFIEAGTLALGPTGGVATFRTLNVATGATFDMSALNGLQNVELGGGGTIKLGDTSILVISAAVPFSGSIIGTGSVYIGAPGITLTGANTYTGQTAINSGTLHIAAGGSLSPATMVNMGSGTGFDIAAAGAGQTIGVLGGDGAVTLGANTLTLAMSGVASTFYGVISGSGGLVNNSDSTLTFRGASTYTGGTTINNGTFAMGAGGSLASTGAVHVGGTGEFNIANGGNQSIGALSGLAGGKVMLGGNTLTVSSASNSSFAGTLSGTGGLTKSGAGVLTLGGASTFGGGTTLNAGGLIVNNDAALGSGTLTVGGAATLDSAGPVALANSVTLNAGLTVLGSNALTINGNISGTGGLTKNGVATLMLNGVNSYTGGTNINGGTLALGAGASLASSGIVNLAAGASFNLSAGNGAQTFGTLTGSGMVNLGANDLTIGGPTNGIFAGSIAGTGGLIKEGTGTQTLLGANTYTGDTLINAGTLAIGAGGSLAANGAVTLAASGTGFNMVTGGAQVIGLLNGVAGSIVTLGNNTLTLSGVSNGGFEGTIAGTGSLVKNGLGIQTLGGTNTFSGGVTLNAGGLVLGNNSALGTGAFSVSGNSSLDTSAALNVGNIIGLDPGVQLDILGSNPLTLSGSIFGAGSLVKNGAATVTLTGANSYTGGTFINAGTLALGPGGSLSSSGPLDLTGTGTFDISSGGNQAIGSLAGVVGSTVALGGKTLTVGGISDTTYAGSIGGSGGLVKNGVGVQALSGASTFSGGVTLNAGGLVVGNDAALGIGALTVGGAATLDTAGTVALANDVVLNAGLTALGTNNLTLNGNVSGTGSLTKDGSATLTLNGTNTYTGGTSINAGTLALGAGASLSSSGIVNVAMGATFDLSAGNGTQAFGTLIGNGAVDLGANSLIVGGPTDGTFSGAIGGTGGLVKEGTGTQTLTGANTYTGSTKINAGTLAIGPGGSTASTSVVMLTAAGTGYDISAAGAQTIGSLQGVAGSTVALGGNDLTLAGVANANFEGVISGAGGLIKNGAATQYLSGANTYSGGTTFSGGVLVLGNNAALGTGTVTVGADSTLDTSSAVTLANGVILGAGSNLDSLTSLDLTLAGAISGAGGLIKDGAATLTLTSANSYNGGTTINFGTLALGAGGSLAATGALDLAGIGTFDISTGGNQTVGALTGVMGSAVALGGNSLTFGTAANATLGSSIGGTGGLIKNGTGVQTLNGASTFGGGVTVNAGGLMVGNDAALGSGVLTVSNAATLDSSAPVTLVNDVVLDAGLTVVGSNNLTLNGAISGTGGLTKNGNATLTLNGVNTYTGGTTVNAGTLALGAGASLASTGIVNLAAGSTFDLSAGNGTQTFGTLMGSGTVLLGTLDLAVGDTTDTTFGGSVGGMGRLIKEGSGTTTMTGTSSYTGGTLINAGTLAIGAGGSLAPNGAVTLTAAGTRFDISAGGNQSIGALGGASGSTVGLGANTLTLSSATDSNYAGTIGGTGGLVKNGSATQTLSGANTYSGGTTINAGALALGAGGGLAATGALNMTGTGIFDISAAGSQAIGTLSGVTGTTVALGGNTLTVNSPSDSVFDGVITGSGGLTKAGNGTLILNATNSYTGNTTVGSGTLEIGDADHASAGILGNVSVGNGGTLRGHGSIGGDVSNGGTVRPGGSIGTLTIAGNYTQSPSATLFIDVSPTAASQLKVGGTATLAGSLNVLYGPGTYSTTSYRIVDAANVAGQFSTITANTPAGITQAVQTSASGATLALTADGTDTGGTGGTGGGTVVVTPTNATIFGAMGSAAIREGQRVNDALLARLSGQACGSSSSSSSSDAANCAQPGKQVWTQLVSNTNRVRGNDDAPSYKDSHYGFLAGLDHQAGAWTLGVAGGYSHIDVREDEASGKIDTVRLAGYGARNVGPVNVAATVGAAYDFLSSRRSFAGVGTAKGDTDGQEFTAGLQASLPLAAGPVVITPRAGLRYQYFHAGRYGEDGSTSQNLDVASQNLHSLQPYAQVSVGLPFNTGAAKPAWVEARVGYAYETLDRGRGVDAAAGDGTRFTLAGVAPSRGMLSAGLGLTLPLGKSTDVTASYDRLFSTGNTSAQTFQLQASYRF